MDYPDLEEISKRHGLGRFKPESGVWSKAEILAGVDEWIDDDGYAEQSYAPSYV
jgi:hypothetical protein